MNIYLDIETIPTQRPEERERIAESVRPPGNYKKEESIAKWWAEEGDAALDDAWRATALSGDWGEIVCVGLATDARDEVRVWTAPSELELLEIAFNGILLALNGQHPTYVGHNVGFDLRFLHHRAVVHGVRPPVLPYNAAPWQGRYIDTMYEWCGAKGGIKLTDLCRILDIRPLQGATGEDISGAEVWDAWNAGEQQKVIDHCLADVCRVRQLWRRLRFQ